MNSNSYRKNCVKINSYNKSNVNIDLKKYPVDIYTNNIINFYGINKLYFNKSKYELFLKKYHEVYGNNPIEAVIQHIIETEPIIGAGKDKQCYIIPKMEDYVIGYLYRVGQLDNAPSLKQSEIRFPLYNFGQPILSNEHNIIIMEKINGVPNLINYTKLKQSFEGDDNVNIDNLLNEYVSNLKQLSHHPQSSYDKLAQKIKYLNDNGQCFDFINPNNILIDSVNNEFNIIDLFNKQENDIISNASKTTVPGAWEMFFALVGLRHSTFLDKMEQNEYKETIKISREIAKKCFIAAEKYGLPTNDKFSRGMDKYPFDFIKKLVVPRLDEIFNLYTPLVK